MLGIAPGIDKRLRKWKLFLSRVRFFLGPGMKANAFRHAATENSCRNVGSRHKSEPEKEIMEISNHPRLRSSFIWLQNKSFCAFIWCRVGPESIRITLGREIDARRQIHAKILSLMEEAAAKNVFSSQIKWKFCGWIVPRSVDVFNKK